MREAELLRPLLLEEIDIASEPEDEKILELIDRLILEEGIVGRGIRWLDIVVVVDLRFDLIVDGKIVVANRERLPVLTRQIGYLVLVIEVVDVDVLQLIGNDFSVGGFRCHCHTQEWARIRF